MCTWLRKCCGCFGGSETELPSSLMGYRTPLLLAQMLEPDRLPGGNSIVVVKLLGLENLGSPKLKVPPHAYVEFSLSPAHPTAGKQMQRSEIKSGRSSPKWEPSAKFKFLVSKETSAKVIISVYHFSTLGIGSMATEPVQLGDAVLHLKELSDSHRNSVRKSLQLHTEDGTRGVAHLEYVFRTPDEESCVQEHIVYEFQRWQPAKHWGHGPGFFLPTDPGRWATIDGAKFSNQIDDVAPSVPPNWVITRSWLSTATEEDADGWEYANDFYAPCWYGKNEGVSLFVRRRALCREVSVH